jgi:hypothetical protein
MIVAVGQQAAGARLAYSGSATRESGGSLVFERLEMPNQILRLDVRGAAGAFPPHAAVKLDEWLRRLLCRRPLAHA